MTNGSSTPTVFISYSHKDEAWKNRLLPQLRALEQAGNLLVWDDRQIDGGDSWYPELRNAMRRATVAICLISPDYLSSPFCVNEEIPFLLERRERGGMALIPVLIRPCQWKSFAWLRKVQMLPRDDKNVLVDYQGTEDALFAEIAGLVFKIVGDPKTYFSSKSSSSLGGMPEKIEIGRLPHTGAALFGRQRELDLLDDAWASKEVNIAVLVGSGGVGKSTLVNEWLKRCEREDYCGARRVFGWSFHSQGMSQRVTSADQFIRDALMWFDDSNPDSGFQWEKGQRLGNCVGSENTLLVLDGIEPLQEGRTFGRGKITDQAMTSLILELARHNVGLCVITTREPLVDLEGFTGSVIQLDLDQISAEAGRALLRIGSVQGTDEELEQVSRSFGNHALTINLLASYLYRFPGHHVSRSSDIPDLYIPLEANKHPRRVLTAFTELFDSEPEIEALRMLGLFDRPVPSVLLEVVRQGTPIPNLTSRVYALSEVEWLKVIERLRRAKLIAPAKHADDVDIDAHPVIREHFSEELKRRFPDALHEGHKRIYEYLKSTVEIFPSTSDSLSVLFTSIVHACEADRYQEAWDMYWHRILRGERVNIGNYGSFNAHLAALSAFFKSAWTDPVEPLLEESKLEMLDSTAFCLWGIGNPTTAEQIYLKTSLKCVDDDDFNNAARMLNNLSALSRIRGNFGEAATYARDALKYAEANVDLKTYAFRIISAKVTLADALYQAGKTSEARNLFEEAEDLHQEKQRHEIRFLYGREGYQYSDFLLDQGEIRMVRQRVQLTLKRARNFKRKRHIALDRLSLGRACLMEAEGGNSQMLEEARPLLEQASNGLREIGMTHHLPPALLVQSALLRLMGEHARARSCIAEAREVATHGVMRPYLADCYLAFARQDLAEGRKESATDNVTKAKYMIEQMGYHRRDRELSEILAQVNP